MKPYRTPGSVTACEAAPLIAMGAQPHYPPLAERFVAAPTAPEDFIFVSAKLHRRPVHRA
jgi:hypothetical protein